MSVERRASVASPAVSGRRTASARLRAGGCWLAVVAAVAAAGCGIGAPPPPPITTAISADGSIVVFDSSLSTLVPGDLNHETDVFARDETTGVTTRVSVSSLGVEGDGDSTDPSVSADGRFVAFESLATNLVAADTNGVSDVFVHDRDTGETTRVSVTSLGGQLAGASANPSLSADGRFVTFDSLEEGLAGSESDGYYDVFVHDRATGVTTWVSRSF